MSDPVTNIEIEDVLSSIKRLVADTDRHEAPVLAENPAPSRQAPRFVLTPDFRIGKEDKHEASIESPDEESPAPVTAAPTLVLGPEDAVARASLEATIAELEAAVTAQPDEWELDGSEVKTEVTWESAGFVSRAALAAAESDTSVSKPEPLTLTEDDLVAEDAPTPKIEAVEETPAPKIEAVEDTPEEEEFTFRRSKPAPVAVETIDHGDELAEIAEPAMDPDAELETYLSGNPSIDEKLLHEMVQRVVREELQGHLGERITRNVRKLVRREIHRVLTNQDFD